MGLYYWRGATLRLRLEVDNAFALKWAAFGYNSTQAEGPVLLSFRSRRRLTAGQVTVDGALPETRCRFPEHHQGITTIRWRKRWFQQPVPD